MEVLTRNEPYIEDSQLLCKNFFFWPLRPLRKAFAHLKKSLGRQNFVCLWPVILARQGRSKFFWESRAVFMLMILLSNLSVIWQLTTGNNYRWPLNLNWMYETLWNMGVSELLISILKKINLFCLTSLITLMLLIWK